MSLRGLYNIPSYADFGAALARGLLKADLDLANALILLPNRRASRTLQTTFLRLREGEAMLLPRMVPMGDLSDEDAVGEAIVGHPHYFDNNFVAHSHKTNDFCLRQNHQYKAGRILSYQTETPHGPDIVLRLNYKFSWQNLENRWKVLILKVSEKE